MNPQPLFYTGGALPPEYPYYVLRQADHAASRAMDKDKLIYIIAPRQMGKTSLLKRLAIRLENQGWHCCFVDLATLRNLKRPRWYRHLGEMIAHARGIDVILSPLKDQQDFRKFLLNDVGLGWSFNPSKIALFLDEVEGLLGLAFSDEFLMTLRDLYQQRDSYPGQLLIAFAGSVDPVILVEDSNISPFNVAEEIVVDDFTLDESLTLTSNLAKMEIPVAEATHNQIYWWARGQPHLTQRICEIIEDWVETRRIPSVSTDVVDRAVGTRLLAPCNLDKNIKHVLGEIADLKSFSAELWKRLLAGEPVYSAETGFYALYLTGAVTEAPDGRVKIRNRIYERALTEIEVPPVPKPTDAPQPQDEFRYDAFISYSHKNSAWVRNTLLPRLEGEGLRVCIDYRDFEVGTPSLVNMENAVKHSRKTLLVLTPAWVKSEWTEFEALLIQTKDPVGRGRRILPLMVQSCELPDRLQVFTYLDLTDPAEFDFQMQRLVAAIRSAPPSPTPTKTTPVQRPTRPSRPMPRGFSQEHGLVTLGELLTQVDVQVRLDFAVLESRMLDNLQDERRYGTSETIRSERARIVQELNRLALTHLGRSFNDLCQA